MLSQQDDFPIKLATCRMINDRFQVGISSAENMNELDFVCGFHSNIIL